MPPTPMAASRLIAPVGIASTRTRGASAPIRMIAPFPQVFSICVIARLSALRRSSESFGTSLSAAMNVLAMDGAPRARGTEYTPKADLPPSRPERVGQVLQPLVRHTNAVEPIDVVGAAVAVHPGACGLHQLAPLGPRHRLERAPEPRPPARHHLNLRMAHPPAMRQHRPPLRLEVAHRLPLGREPVALALIPPAVRIAP